MNIEMVRTEAEGAVQHFGLGRLCRLDAVFGDINGSYLLRMIDTRKSRFCGLVFSVRIEATENTTPHDVREFIKSQIAEQFGTHSVANGKPGA
jgi:hypothetical protein